MANPLQDTSGVSAQFASSAAFREIGLPWRLLLFSAFLFGFSVFVFIGLRLGYASYLDARSGAVEKDIAKLSTSVSANEQQRLVLFYSQLVNTQNILSKHRFSYNLFPFLERYTAEGVYFLSAGLSADSAELDLKGRASSMQGVVGQLAVFDAAPEITSVVLKETGLDGSGMSFGVLLKLKPDFFEKLQ
ncbi:hypothetical protein A3A21_00760 [Candidatus Jorgensenbacteria bacterium RIFCSPLOWO2_01_FULL_45_25b]|uniref:PilN domain-containing protein n=1 Tax=Candidatus Jorgensenbacteria bacterium RIFCSPLOWO2_01_FULL_45_25b TaxID=1798471 RepID=A0A1F6BZW1_9BACT|nr:MAG: hypothetical protein A3A21_00760 [Candidatus Jorgensenbacteria bacterium RIFCSPLOWO2_01_FULL_45_25b]